MAGGIESMSRMPYLVDATDARWGHAWATSSSSTRCTATASTIPLSGLIMGETAEMLARQYGITREESDRFALESQQKAEAAQKAGYFDAEIAPVDGDRARARRCVVDTDEHPRPARRSRRWRSCR